ncbi:unnamed protein product [Caenorhabditis angaria]|uniref:SWIM-type domain-containing protein n=1 Tax=Caenorhabditis angaria TaxID=860376 RepID=A0A9P1IUI7_9PELO|nr:unnamed protein product [Caenorhabditis angaria]
MAEKWNLFEILKETFKKGLQNPEEIGDLVPFDVLATGLQLSETNSVIEIKNSTGNSKKQRVFENFVENETKNVVLKSEAKSYAMFIEVENTKTGEASEFQFPGVHFCSCDYFKQSVLENSEDWTCCHLIASNVTKTFKTSNCDSEIISTVVKKLIVKPFVENHK